MADVVPPAWLTYALESTSLNLETVDTLRCILLVGYLGNEDEGDTTFNDITGYEHTGGSGYDQYGVTMGTCAVSTVAGSPDFCQIDTATNPQWTSSTITNARHAAIVHDANQDGTLASGDLVICIIDFGANYSTVSGTFDITWAGTGFLNLNGVNS